MTTAATLDTNLTLNSTAFRQGMISAAQQANTSLKSIQVQAEQTATVLTTLNKAVMAFGAFETLKAGLGSLLEAQVQLQSIQYTLLSATGNSIAAGEAMSFLRSESDKLGLSLPDTAEGFARLAAAATASGVSMSAQQGLFDAFAKASSTLHLSTAQSGRALLALQEMFSRGVISARQLNQQLGQAIPGSAARFKNAVMEMVKGTDLAGKSFDQIQKSGKLITTEFLPALTAALQGAGSGWEEASQGLNANLNRLSTAWFNLKTELSGGLFSDAASSGAALLAQNLNKVATALQLVAGVAIARGLGSVLGRGASNAQFQIQSYTGTRMAAAAEREYADAQVLSAKAATLEAEAEAARNARILESIEGVRAQRMAFAAKAEEDVRNALATRNAAAAAIIPASGNAFLPGQNVQGVAALEAAEAKLANAQRLQAVVQAGQTSLMEQSAVARAELSAADGVLTASEDALTAAQARAAETRALETAVGGLGAAIGRTAASFGNFALSLVGGPWGVAVLAIGGVAYAFESAKSEAEHLEIQTRDNAKAVEVLVKDALDLRDAFKEVGNTDPFSKLKDSADTLSAALVKNQQDLAAATAAKAQLDKENNNSIIEDAWHKITGATDAAKNSVDQLTTAGQQLSSAYGSAASASVAAYGANWDEVRSILVTMPFTIDGVTKALDRLQGATNRAMSLDAVVDNARNKLKEYQDGIEKAAEASSKRLRQKSMTPAQAAADDLRQAQADALAGHTNGLDAAATAAAQLNIQNLKGIQAAEDAKKAASEAAAAAKARARAAADLATAQQGELAAAKAQLEQDDKMVPARKQLNEEIAGGVKAYNDMTAAQKATSRATLEQAAALEEQYIAQEKAKRSAQALAGIEEAMADRARAHQREYADALASYGIGAQESADQKKLDELQKHFDNERRLIDKNKALTDADRAQAILDNQAELDTETAAYRTYMQQRADAEGNAMNGLKTAVANFVNAQNNMAALAEKFTGDFISQFGDAFAKFASGTETAKKAFGDFITSMYQEAWKFVADQTIKSLLLSFSAPGTAGQPGQGQSIWSNLKSSLFGGFAAGTGNTAAQAQIVATTANTTAVAALTAALTAQAGLNAIGGSGLSSGVFSALFGGSGSGDSSGISSFLPAATSMFGGGLAGGGAANANSIYQVAESGPEMLSVGDKSYLMMGSRGGTVTPNSDLRSGGNSSVTNIYVQPTSTRRTVDQIAQAMDHRQRMASARNG